VRLFRTLRFTAKAVIISLAFVLPLLGLLGWQREGCRPTEAPCRRAGRDAPARGSGCTASSPGRTPRNARAS
jgi:hypothetical protein